MDYIEELSIEEKILMKNNIEKYLFKNDYKNAFIMFLIYIARMNLADRDDFIIYFKNFFREKNTK